MSVWHRIYIVYPTHEELSNAFDLTVPITIGGNPNKCDVTIMDYHTPICLKVFLDSEKVNLIFHKKI
jgi:hypothetical protein